MVAGIDGGASVARLVEDVAGGLFGLLFVSNFGGLFY